MKATPPPLPPAFLVQDFLQQTAAWLPDKVALICDGQRFTYAEIDRMADRMAGAFVELGVRRGDRVAIQLGNSLECVVSIFSALKAGGVFVVLNPTVKRDKLIYILNNCRASVLVVDGKHTVSEVGEPNALPVRSLMGVVVCGKSGTAESAGLPQVVAFESLIKRSSPARLLDRAIDLDLACLIYTSGTTGEPKGVMCDHSNVVFAANSIISYLGNTERDVVINSLPLSFDYGLYQLLMTFRFGGTLVLEKSFAYPSAILKLMEAERVTGFPGVPTMFAMLTRMDLSSFNLSSLRYLTNTAAALPPSHIEEIRRKFPHVKLFSMYGLTETKRTLYLPPEELNRRPGSVGMPIPGTEAWVEDESGNRLGAGKVGELVIRGRHVMRGYWEAPEASAARYRPGSLPGERLCYSGDLFRTDEDGFFYFVARKDDIIKSRGEKVAPKEVESVIHGIEGVAEAAVVGVPDPILGQAVKAIVVAKQGVILTANEVLLHCKRHLEDYMVPKQVEFRSELPHTTSGKVKRSELV